jgi:hypothetical protein
MEHREDRSTSGRTAGGRSRLPRRATALALAALAALAVRLRVVMLALGLSLFYSTTASAACSATACDGKANDIVVDVYPSSSGNILVELSAPDRSNLNCTPFQGSFATLEPSHVRFKEVYATILFAMAMNKRLIVRIGEGSSNCSISYVRAFSA